MLASTLLLAMLAPQAAAQPAPSAEQPASAWILRCDMGAPASAPAGTASGVRTFRLAPKVFQEWRSDTRAFGPNLCSSFPCRADKARLEGVIQTRTLVLTITMDRFQRSATWKAQGASGLSRNQGACAVSAETKPPQGAVKGTTG